MFGLALLMLSCEEEDPLACFEINKTEFEVGESISFTNCSQNAANYYWTFDDGESSTEFEPTHSYNTPGHYEVNLDVQTKRVTKSDFTETIIDVQPKDLELFIGSFQGTEIYEDDFDTLVSAKSIHITHDENYTFYISELYSLKNIKANLSGDKEYDIPSQTCEVVGSSDYISVHSGSLIYNDSLDRIEIQFYIGVAMHNQVKFFSD